MGSVAEGVLVLGGTALFLWSAVTIVDKAGYNGWWALLLLLPLVNVVAVFWFACADWPALRDRSRLTSAPPR